MDGRALFLCLLCFFVYKSEQNKEKFSAPDSNDINEIVRTIVDTDKLNITNTPLSIDLTKIKVSKTYIKYLLAKEVNNNQFFSKSDSSYIFFQNKAIKSFKIDSSISKIIKLTTGTRNSRKQQGFFRRYEVTLPIFSLDKKRAFVALDYYCPLCGYGKVIYLEKVNGKWRIVEQTETWIS